MMETKSKRNILIWAIILLVILNISSLTTIWYHRYQNKARIERLGKNKMLPQGKKYRARKGVNASKLLARNLKLSSGQQEKFDSIWSFYSVQKLDYEDIMNENHFKMSNILGQAIVDTSEFYALSDQQGLLLIKLNQSMMAMNIAMRNTLDERQMQTFLQKIKMLNKGRVKAHKQQPATKRRNN